MNQYQKRIIAGVFVGIVILSGIYIILPKVDVVHTAYATLILAILLTGASLWQLSRSAARDYITGVAFPLALQVYLLITVFMAVLLVVLDLAGAWSIPIKWYAALQIIVIGVTAWRLLIIGAAQDAIARTGQHVQEMVSSWKQLQADVDAILQIAPSSLHKDVKAVRDAIRFTDHMSIPEVAEQEVEIDKAVILLRTLVSGKNDDEAMVLCKNILNLIRDRANRLKTMK